MINSIKWILTVYVLAPANDQIIAAVHGAFPSLLPVFGAPGAGLVKRSGRPGLSLDASVIRTGPTNVDGTYPSEGRLFRLCGSKEQCCVESVDDVGGSDRGGRGHGAAGAGEPRAGRTLPASGRLFAIGRKAPKLWPA